jgi:hypothetical protein
MPYGLSAGGRRVLPQAADDAALSKDPEFRAVLDENMRSADEVLSYAPKDAAVEADFPVPHWGWTGLE